MPSSLIAASTRPVTARTTATQSRNGGRPGEVSGVQVHAKARPSACIITQQERAHDCFSAPRLAWRTRGAYARGCRDTYRMTAQGDGRVREFADGGMTVLMDSVEEATALCEDLEARA